MNEIQYENLCKKLLKEIRYINACIKTAINDGESLEWSKHDRLNVVLMDLENIKKYLTKLLEKNKGINEKRIK